MQQSLMILPEIIHTVNYKTMAANHGSKDDNLTVPRYSVIDEISDRPGIIFYITDIRSASAATILLLQWVSRCKNLAEHYCVSD